MTDSIENIGLMIRDERLRKGLTQEELGKRIGVGKAQISKIESGKGLTIKTITKVLDALGMSASVILQNTQAIDKNVIVYIVAVINEFAKTYHISVREANNYLMVLTSLRNIMKQNICFHWMMPFRILLKFV